MRGWLAAICTLLLPVLPVQAADIPVEANNPQPLADDLVLPMPCGGMMVFRPIIVPVKDRLDDRRFPAGGIDDALGYKENQHAEYISGSFTDSTQKSQRLYYLGKYVVTRWQYRALDAACPPAGIEENRLPKTGVSWFEAVGFADRYSQWLLAHAAATLPAESGQPGFVRLPTEAEWEYAARGGVRVTEADFSARLFPMNGPLARYVWYGGPESSNNELQPIGLLDPNPLGLFDMLGNTGQLVLDAFRLNRLARLQGAAGGFIVRGSNYLTPKDEIRSAAREEFPPYDKTGLRRDQTVGFRLALVAPILPTLAVTSETRTLWQLLPAASGPGLAEPVQDDPIKELAALANAVEDRALKQRLQGLGVVFAATIRTRDDQRDRAARASLNLASWLALALRAETRRLLMVEESLAAGNEQVRAKLPEQNALLTRNIGYYRDTIQNLNNEYPAEIRAEQAEILRRELEQRNIPLQAAILDNVARDIEAWRRQGDLPLPQLEAGVRQEICGGRDGAILVATCHANKP